MPITVNTNMPSIDAQRRLSISSSALAKTYQRLSSGLRITSASDDDAGLAIADTLRANRKIASVAIRNANDGVSLISIADSALNEVSLVLARMAELAEQSGSGFISSHQRSALTYEFVSLGSEVQRIAELTEFNGISLLSGGSEVTLQIGLNADRNSQVSFSGVQATLHSLSLAPASNIITYSINASTTQDAQTASRNALGAIKLAIASLTMSRGALGAAESRLNTTVSNLQISRQNFIAAESRIRDVDVAEEAATLTKLNILQQAGSSILGQANQQPSLALSLLR